MSKLNKPNTNPTLNKVGVSYNGNVQDLKDAEMQLYEVVTMTLYGKDEFYESTDARVNRLRSLVANVVAKGNLDFVGNLIIHARTVMNIRSMPIVLVVEFAKALRDQNKQYASLRKVTCDVIQRADQLSDLYSYALAVFGSKKAVPAAIKRGVADAFEKFDEYQFGKYDRAGAVKIRDVLRIVHPSGKTPEQGELFRKIMSGELQTPYTWETELSRNGQLPAAERKSNAQLWTELVNSKKVPYMALLRNVRNILEARVSQQTLDSVCSRISDETQVARSKQLPFRFLNAIEAVTASTGASRADADQVRTAIRKATQLSLANVPSIGDNVWIILDVSGSMQGRPVQTGALFAAALIGANREATNVKLTVFSDRASHVNIARDGSFFTNVEAIQRQVTGGGTNLSAALNLKKSLGFEPDTIIVLSDMQVDQLDGGRTAVRVFDERAVKVAFNLNAYDSTPISVREGWYQLSGWSERAFDFIPAMRDKVSVVDSLSRPYRGLEAFKKAVKRETAEE